MSVHPLSDLGWKIHDLLLLPGIRDRFVARCREHLTDLRESKPRGTIADYYVGLAGRSTSEPVYPPRKDTTLGWLSAQDDEYVTTQEKYALLAALRDCVYKGGDRVIVFSPGTSLEELTDNHTLATLWNELVKAANERLTAEHRNHVESWLRDVRRDLAQEPPASATAIAPSVVLPRKFEFMGLFPSQPVISKSEPAILESSGDVAGDASLRLSSVDTAILTAFRSLPEAPNLKALARKAGYKYTYIRQRSKSLQDAGLIAKSGKGFIITEAGRRVFEPVSSNTSGR